MISVTNNYIWLKCYLNFNVIVAGGMRSCKTLARAINHKYSFLEKKLKEIVYSFLSTLTTNSSSSANIVHEILSFSTVPPMVTPFDEPMIMRKDEVTEGNQRADVLANAPAGATDEFFSVPKMVE